MKFVTTFLTERDRPWRDDLAALLILFSVAFFQGLGRIPLLDPDEGRYAEIPREMLERGDFITPFLNYVKYFEKPPLHYWLNALAFKVFGDNAFAARFPGALMGLGTVLLTYYFGRRLFGRREGLFAALILGTSTGFLVQARIDITDMTLTFCMTACLGYFLLGSRSDRQEGGVFYYLFYLFAALAVLAKGLIGMLLPGAVIFWYLLLCRRWRLLREMRLVSGLLLFFAVAAPWFIAVSLKNPEFARFFFIHEHFERFLTKVHGRYQPIWYFIPVLIGTMLPWSFFIPSGVKGIWQERTTREGESRFYLLIWAVVIFLFFSKSNSKLVPYILPVFPALALLMGFRCARFTAARLQTVQGYVTGAFLTVAGAGCMAYPHLSSKGDIPIMAGTVIGSIFFCQGLFALRATYTASFSGLFTGMMLFSYLLGVVGPPLVLAGIAEKKSVKVLGERAAQAAGEGAVIASFGLQQGLPYYTKRRVLVVGGPGETEFGSLQGDQSAWFLDLPRFARLWDSSVPVVLLLAQGELEQLQGVVRTVPRIIASQGRKLLVSNR